jgi:hypothetical protein
MKTNNNLPLFLHDEKDNEILKMVQKCIPKETRVYLVGGAVRNAIYYKYFKKALPQRDFDMLLIGDRDKFVENLRELGFTYGRIRRKFQVVLRIKRVSKPIHRFNDYLYLEIHSSEEKSVMKNIAEHANFTINGSVLSLRDIFKDNWMEKLISLPGALSDLKNKRLKLNASSHPANLFACFRFMSLGFKKPPQADINTLLRDFSNLQKSKYDKNIQKLYTYVGGEKKAKSLAKKLNIKENIFDFEEIKKAKIDSYGK